MTPVPFGSKFARYSIGPDEPPTGYRSVLAKPSGAGGPNETEKPLTYEEFVKRQPLFQIGRRATRRGRQFAFARAFPKRQVIRLAPRLLDGMRNGQLTIGDVLGLLLHELAHLQTPGHHHDRVWRDRNRALGGAWITFAVNGVYEKGADCIVIFGRGLSEDEE